MPVNSNWSPEDVARRNRILAAAHARGVTHRTLARAAKINETRMHRWCNCEGFPLPDECVEAMERALATADAAGESETAEGAIGAAELGAAIAELDRLAGDPADPEKDELRELVRRHRRAAVGSLLRLMVGAKSENVRLRATELLLERIDGKAVQQILDLTPKPPATDEELIGILERINLATRADPAPSDGTPSADSSGDVNAANATH
jgi:hypothetical protein